MNNHAKDVKWPNLSDVIEGKATLKPDHKGQHVVQTLGGSNGRHRCETCGHESYNAT